MIPYHNLEVDLFRPHKYELWFRDTRIADFVLDISQSSLVYTLISPTHKFWVEHYLQSFDFFKLTCSCRRPPVWYEFPDSDLPEPWKFFAQMRYIGYGSKVWVRSPGEDITWDNCIQYSGIIS